MAAIEQAVQYIRPSGPVANAYGQSQARVAFCVGPTGGGKTTESVRRIIRVAQLQKPSPRDGIRKARITCVGPTYRRLWDTAIPSYRQTMAKWGFLNLVKDKQWTGSKGDPAEHIFDLNWPGFGQLHLEVKFRAVQEMDLEDFVRGNETTAWWDPEADTLPRDLIQLQLNRVGRYPEPDDRPDDGEETYRGVFGDANVPDIDDWFYDMMWLSANRPSHWHLFRQPAGVLANGEPNPDAENLHNLRKISPNYYRDMMADMEQWAIKRFLMCKPGYSRHGQPVHEDFDDEVHVAKGPLEVDPRAMVVIGVDGGGNTNLPGATFGQRDYGGNWRVFADYSPKCATSAPEVGQEIRRVLATRFRRAKGAVIFIDPAANVRSPLSPINYAMQVQNAAGVEVRTAPSNRPDARRSALKKPLMKRGGFLVDPDCTDLIKALAGGFRYSKLMKAKGALVVDKGIWSHVAESCEYMCYGGDGQEGFDNGMDAAEGDDLYPEPIL